MNLKISTDVWNDMIVVYFCFEGVITFFGVSPNKMVSWDCCGKVSMETNEVYGNKTVYAHVIE